MRCTAFVLLALSVAVSRAETADRDLDVVRHELELEGERLGRDFGGSYRSKYSKDHNVIEFWAKSGTKIGEAYGEAFGRSPDAGQIGADVGREVGREVGRDMATHLEAHLRTELEKKECEAVGRFMKEYGLEAGKAFGKKVHARAKAAAGEGNHWEHAWVPYYWQGIGGGFGEVISAKLGNELAHASKWADVSDEALGLARRIRDDGQDTVDFVAEFGKLFDAKFLGL